MAKAKNTEAQLGAELENDTQATETATAETPAKAKKEFTAEDAAVLEAGLVKLKEFGVSEKMAQVLPLVSVWHDKEGNGVVKEQVIEAFGGNDKFKDYIVGDFLNELQTIQGLQKVASTLNNIKSFYLPRESKAKAKMQPLVIAGESYTVNSEFYASVADLSRDEKIAAILGHEDTKKNAAVEIL